MSRTSVCIPATRNWKGGRSYKRPPKVGRRIHHDIFGAGAVTHAPPGYINIEFDVHGLKSLQWMFALRNGRIRTLHPVKP